MHLPHKETTMVAARFSAALCLLAGSLAWGQAATPARPDDAVPGDVLKDIKAKFVPPATIMSPQEKLQILTDRMKDVLRAGSAAEDKHPQAKNLHEVRVLMLQAAGFLAGRDEEGAQDLLLGIAQRTLKGDAPPEVKVEADRVLTGERLKTLSGEKLQQEIRDLAKRFKDTPAAGAAVAYAAILAAQHRQTKLRDELLSELEAKYADTNPEITGLLRRMGRKIDVGKPFQAELTGLDGRKLTLPKDLLGKVVVIDFWASWCPPCAVSAPELREVYQKVKDKGVQFVGISLDREKSAVEDFVKRLDLGWIQTFSGQGWEDPTASRYGIRSIPSLWVVGRDGKVTSSDARAHLEEEIQKALDAETK